MEKLTFEIKTDSLDDSEIDILFQKMLSILEPDDIVSSFNWKAIQSFKDLFNAVMELFLIKKRSCFKHNHCLTMMKTYFLWLTTL